MIRQRYESILADLRAAADWLTSIGVPVNPSRLGTYESDIQLAIRAACEGGRLPPDTERNNAEVTNSLLEGIDIAEIYKSFRSLSSEKLPRRKLQIAVEGPATVAEEDRTSNEPRNILFELAIAAKLLRGGLNPSMPINPDLQCEINGVVLFFQCKRPFYDHTIADNIDRAAGQLKRDLPDQPDAVGVIAMDVSRCVNPGTHVLRLPSETAVEEKLDGYLCEIYRSYCALIPPYPESRIGGILLRLITPAIVGEEQLSVLAEQLLLVSHCADDIPTGEAIRRLEKVLRRP